MTTILGIKMNSRVENAENFQAILTKYGCSIKTRVGLHRADKITCSPYGIILLDITDENDARAIEKELLNISEIELQKMVFDD
ncbi:MAG: hypothetical protein PHV37_08025 [Candidatus Gastranaerophilales bacterium]|nr:hypothetical protein [Candidatus Gastranaerophilales bacterium]